MGIRVYNGADESGADRRRSGKTDPAYGLTRYEMVQMVANAVRNRNRGTAEEQKKIDRLAKEFADDLTYAGLNPEEEGNAGVAFDWRDDTKKKY